MRKMVVLLLLCIIACKAGERTLSKKEEKHVRVHYSKSPCMGNCPVYDFYVLNDGRLIYKEINNGRRTLEIESRISTREVSDLVQLIDTSLTAPTIFRRIRDLPITRLRLDDMEYEYHAARINGQLKLVDSKIEDLIAKRLAKP